MGRHNWINQHTDHSEMPEHFIRFMLELRLLSYFVQVRVLFYEDLVVVAHCLRLVVTQT